jgi:uncharacterized membrane protein YesL
MFGMDGKLYRALTLVYDLIVVSVLWVICSVPVFTIGAATTAAYYVFTRRVSGREGYISSDFFKSFKRDFLISTLLWLFFVFYGVICYVALDNVAIFGEFSFFCRYFIIFGAAEGLFSAVFAFPVAARFKLTFFGNLRMAFVLANRHLFTSITSGAFAFAAVYGGVAFSPVFSVCVVGFYTFITSYLFMRVFRKYLPDMDVDKDKSIG